MCPGWRAFEAAIRDGSEEWFDPSQQFPNGIFVRNEKFQYIERLSTFFAPSRSQSARVTQ